MKHSLKSIIEATNKGQLKWEKFSSNFSFVSFCENGDAISVNKNNDGSLDFMIVDDKGREYGINDLSVEKDEIYLNTLYESILNSNKEIRKSENRSVSLYKIEKKIITGKKINIKSNDSFKYLHFTKNKKYVYPEMSHQPTFAGYTSLDEAQVITISAAGATGKSAMTEHLSETLNVPVLDLHELREVGTYSFVGMLYDTLDISEMASFIQNLRSGQQSMIIDALDEGYIKVNHAAFESFLDNLVSISFGCKGLPFVIMGRTSIVEFATAYMEEKGVKVCMLQIEPFVRETAVKYIDEQMNDEKVNRFEREYKNTRDYIINSIEGFFKDKPELNRRASERFIGYAPVLQTIVELLNEKQNYLNLKLELEKRNSKRISLIRDITEQILTREQKKIQKDLLSILEGQDEKVISDITNRAYSHTEQCVRILYQQLGKPYNEPLTNDPSLNTKYEKLIENWFKEHPFICKQKIQNIVFEGYIVCLLMQEDEYKDDVLDFLKIQNSNSYILFDLFNIMCHSGRHIDHRFVKYLGESYRALENTQNRYLIELTSKEDNNDIKADNDYVECELLFESHEDEDYQPYYVRIDNDKGLELPDYITNMYVDAPIEVIFGNNNLELSPSVNIWCKKIKVLSKDILITPSVMRDSIVLDCGEFEARTNENKLQSISNKGNVSLNIITQSTLFYPFASYKTELASEIPDDELFMEKYQKLRRTIVQFRAHSRGNLAKYKDKINNRIGNTDIGKKVMDKLKASGIIVEKGHLYYIDDKKMADILGVGFNGIRTCQVNPKIIKFLNG